jgi:hypothetical protein
MALILTSQKSYQICRFSLSCQRDVGCRGVKGLLVGRSTNFLQIAGARRSAGREEAISIEGHRQCLASTPTIARQSARPAKEVESACVADISYRQYLPKTERQVRFHIDIPKNIEYPPKRIQHPRMPLKEGHKHPDLDA